MFPLSPLNQCHQKNKRRVSLCPNSQKHLQSVLSLICLWCFQGRTQNQKCSRRLWSNSVRRERERRVRDKWEDERDATGRQLDPSPIWIQGLARDKTLTNGGVVTMETGWKEADSVTCCARYVLGCSGTGGTRSRSVYQNNLLYKWIIGWNTRSI